MSSIVKTLAHNLARLRKDRKLTQEVLAEMAGVHVNTLRNIEGGKTWPEFPIVKALAAALDIDEGLLFSAAYTRPPPSLEDSLAVISDFAKSLTPARRDFLAAASALDEHEIAEITDRVRAKADPFRFPVPPVELEQEPRKARVSKRD